MRRLSRFLDGDVILPALLEFLSVSADDEAIVRKSTAIYESLGKRPAPTSLHQAIGSELYAVLSIGGSDRYCANSSCGVLAALLTLS